MSSTYFTIPSFARAKRNKEDLEKTNPQEPVLNDEDEQFLNQHISQYDAAPKGEEVPAAKITDDGLEKEASKEEQEQVGDSTVQAVIPETQPETGDGQQSPEEGKSYDDLMKEKAAERVKARKEKKKRSLDLPSQEEAEAATRRFNTKAAQEPESPEGSSKRTWKSYLPSVRPSSKQSNSTSRPTTPDDTHKNRTWKDYATSYVPTIPTSWKLTPKDKDARPASPVYNSDGTINEPLTREKQEREISVLLDQLSLSQINNRVFSFSSETQKIYERFAQVLKDTINGAPTAYEDMETLMKEAGPKLEKQFKAMPPFVRTLVKSLPAKIGSGLGPEILAVAGEKPGAEVKVEERPSTADSGVNIPEGKEETKKRRRIPGLKSLLSKEGAVASMLRNVVNFLQTRFPFLASTTNVAMSLAVFSKLSSSPCFLSLRRRLCDEFGC